MRLENFVFTTFIPDVFKTQHDRSFNFKAKAETEIEKFFKLALPWILGRAA